MSEEDFDLWLYNDEGDLSGEAELALNEWSEKGLREALGEGETNFTRLNLQRDGMPTDYSIIKASLWNDEVDDVNWIPDLPAWMKICKNGGNEYHYFCKLLHPTTKLKYSCKTCTKATTHQRVHNLQSGKDLP
jgi:hypothetical protein